MTNGQTLSHPTVLLLALMGCSSSAGPEHQPGTTSNGTATAAHGGTTVGALGGSSAPVSGGVTSSSMTSGGAGASAAATRAQSAQAGAVSTGASAAVSGSDGAAGEPMASAGTAGAPLTPASAEASGSAASGAAGVGAAMNEACDPSSKTADATPVTGVGTGAAPTGSFKVVVELDPGLTDHTVYRPQSFGMMKYPVLAWGNGGCSKMSTGFSEFLMELASHGIVIIADGTPTASGMGSGDGKALIQAIDWAEKENQRPCSKYYRQLSGKFAVSGQSCGGLMAINASTDKRITTSMPMNSGLFARDQMLYQALHAPMAIFDGGPNDIAYQNGQADFMAIDNIPILFANAMTGHGGTYWDDNGGEFAQVATAWLSWWLFDDQGPSGKGFFVGAGCGLCMKSNWTMMWKMEPQ